VEKLAIGDQLQFKGPLGEYTFSEASPTFSKEKATTPYKSLGLIAGGSGITPCLQVATAVLAADLDVQIKLLYANQTPEDILCQEELDVIVKDPRVKLWYTVDRAPEGWKYSTGFINEEMLREHMPAASEHTYVFMCGPPPMLKFACRPNLDKLGHTEEHVLEF